MTTGHRQRSVTTGRSRWWLIGGLVAAAMAAAVVVLTGGSDPPETGPPAGMLRGQPAPEVALPTADGKVVLGSPNPGLTVVSFLAPG